MISDHRIIIWPHGQFAKKIHVPSVIFYPTILYAYFERNSHFHPKMKLLLLYAKKCEKFPSLAQQGKKYHQQKKKGNILARKKKWSSIGFHIINHVHEFVLAHPPKEFHVTKINKKLKNSQKM